MDRGDRLQSISYISFSFPSKRSLPPCSLHTAPTERDTPSPDPFQPYFKVPGGWAYFRFPKWAHIKRDAHPQSIPFINFMAPSNAAPPSDSTKRAPIEGCPVSRATLKLSLRVPGERTSHEVTSVPPHILPVHQIPALSLKVTGKWSPPPRSLSGSLSTEKFISRANGLFIHLYLLGLPIRRPPTKNGEKQLDTAHRAPRGRMSFIKWGAVWFLKGIV